MMDNSLIIKKGAQSDTTIPQQWINKEGLKALSLHLDGMGLQKFKENLSKNGYDYDLIDTFVIDEAHEDYAFLFYGHGCHIRHQGKDHIDTLVKRYNESRFQPIMEIAKDKIIILVSDTLDSIICEELPMYSGIFPMDIIVIKPTDEYYNDIPSIEYIKNDMDICSNKIYDIYKNLDTKKCIIYTDKVEKSESLKRILIDKGVDKHHVTCYNYKTGSQDNIDLYKITIFVDKGSFGN